MTSKDLSMSGSVRQGRTNRQKLGEPDGSSPRLPDFLIIGTMKSGTTSLFRWLAEHPEFVLPEIKEPHFFSHDDVWGRGLDWYSQLFGRVPDSHLTGEASFSYTSPGLSAKAAKRIARALPNVRLICLLRDPIERMRSHYRHEVQRGREQRPFLEAIQDPGNPYLAQSFYATCLGPYVQSFPREQILVVRFEDLVSDPAVAWFSVLAYLGVRDHPAPGTAHNVTAEKARYTPLMLWLWESGLVQPLSRLPLPVRKLGKRLLLKRDPAYEARLKESRAPVPAGAMKPMWEDVARLERWLGVAAPLWERDGGSEADIEKTDILKPDTQGRNP